MPIFLPRSYIVWCFLAWIIYKVYKKPEPELIAVIYFVIICFILCELYMLFIKGQITIVPSKLPDQVNKDEKLTLKLTVYNRSFLPAPYIYIFLKDSYHIVPEQYKCLCVTLPPHGQKEFTFELIAKQSGKEVVGIEKIIINDLFELVRRKVNYHFLQQVTVLPQPVTLKGIGALLASSALDKNENDDIRQTAFVEDGEVSYELKPYVEGQSQRLIHWKLVAQRDIYMVREREQLIKLKRERIVVVDPVVQLEKDISSVHKIPFEFNGARKRWQMGRDKAKLTDKLVNGTTSYLLEVLKQGESILLFYYDEEQWQQIRLEVIQDLEKISEKISGCMLQGKTVPEVRLPQIPAKGYCQSILITAGMDRRLRRIIEEEGNIKVLELQKRSMLDEQGYGQYWYLSDDYQIVTNG